MRIDELGMAMGRVDFGGIVKEVCLAFVPEVEVGEYVLVHVGFALSRIDEAHARDIFRALADLDAMAEADGVGDAPSEARDAVR